MKPLPGAAPCCFPGPALKRGQGWLLLLDATVFGLLLLLKAVLFCLAVEGDTGDAYFWELHRR